jgi:hypothetical protein
MESLLSISHVGIGEYSINRLLEYGIALGQLLWTDIPLCRWPKCRFLRQTGCFRDSFPQWHSVFNHDITHFAQIIDLSVAFSS